MIFTCIYIISIINELYSQKSTDTDSMNRECMNRIINHWRNISGLICMDMDQQPI